jgi:ATP-binding cassette subfamily C protein
MDGTDIRNINIDDIYKIMSIIHQNVFIFDSTVKDNITLYKDYSDDEINTTIKLCGLYNFVNSKPKKLLENVGENGVLLSGGEKQRIAIARAIIKKTPILILDEATSSLDSETAHSIENSLLDIDELTCIVVTHNLSESILKQYDSIIAMKDGQIEEQGNFYDLLDKKGYFYSLYNVFK